MSRKHFKKWSVDDKKVTGLNGYVYIFSADYDATAGDDIEDIHKYLTKKSNIVCYVRTCLKDTSRKVTFKYVCIY